MTKLEKINQLFRKNETFVSICVVIIVALIAYIPSMKGAGFYGDDYHIAYGVYTSGVEKLIEISSIDRPIHGVTFSLYYPVFGLNIHAYQVFEICLNIFTALCAYWLVRMVWPNQKSAAFVVAAMMTIYPGYIDHMKSFNFCLFMLNLFLYILSLSLTAKSMLVGSKPIKIFLLVVSLFTFLWAVLINEYYIGLEVFRLGIIYVIFARIHTSFSGFWKKTGRVLADYIPYLLTGIGFFIWRFFIFTNQRNATNLGSFTSAFTASPVYESLSTLKGLFTNFLNVTFLAWGEPLYKYFNQLRLKDFLFCAALALVGAIIVYLVIHKRNDTQTEEKVDHNDWLQIILISAITVLATLFPIVFSNRNVTFEDYGRYALPGMIAGILFLVALLYRFVNSKLRNAILCLFVFSGIFTQLGVGKTLAADWQGSKDLWWQLSWRAPSLEPGTLLTGYASDYAIAEGFNLWAPANLIYYPEETNPVVNGETLNVDFIHTVMEDKDTTRDFRSYLLENETENLLVLSKPSGLSCLHLINGDAANYSTYDPTNILLIGGYSNLNQVVTSAQPSAPPAEIFGPEPEHGWCYYYQKAELALQEQQYEEVIHLRDEASLMGLKQGDASELLPFLLAYAQLGDEEGLNEILPIFMDSPFLKVNYCANLHDHRYGISDTANQLLLERSCQVN